MRNLGILLILLFCLQLVLSPAMMLLSLGISMPVLILNLGITLLLVGNKRKEENEQQK